jgi:hypothetical protein
LAFPLTAPSFVSDETELDARRLRLKLVSCPHCRKVGMLIGHGLRRGYSERSSVMVVRGRRVFCSNRARRTGCGRTFSVKLATVLCGFLVRTLTLWHFASAVVGGLTRRAAWLREGALSLSSGYRLWRRLCTAQSALRVRLCSELPAPPCAAPEPFAQLLAHLAVVIGAGAETDVSDPFSGFQLRTQRRLLDA